MGDQNQFNGKTAVITGAGEGIGFQIAADLVANGASVLLNDLDAEKARQAAAQIDPSGKQCIGVGGDVAEVEVVRQLVTQTVNAFGKVDFAIANAGITLWNNFFEYDPEAFFKVLQVNLGGTFFLAQAAANAMRSQKSGGKILLMSSVTGLQAIEYLSAYAMSKAAISMLARQLVVELGPHGININAIAPGATVTPRNLADDPNYEHSWGAVTPSKRSGTVNDIANTALFLLSQAADQITGQTLVVDGGWTATSPVPPLDFVDS